MKFFSIIIPVYKGQDYIEECVRSIAKQDIDSNDFEIIVVIDGSPDDSFAIVLELQKSIKNIILINQDNAGVSNARNNGINNSTGKWVLFADHDDVFIPNTLKNFKHILSFS